MKYFKIATVAIAVTAIMIGCKSKTPKELIVNKWQMSDISGGDAREMSDSAKAEAKKAVMEFTNDGKFHMTGSDITYEGSYSVSEDGKMLTMTPASGGKPEEDSIKEITGDKLVLTDKSGTKLECVVKK